MNAFIRYVALILCIPLVSVGPLWAQTGAPHLVSQGNAIQLHVDEEPFLMLAGELGNSTASSLEELNRHWETFDALNVNTLLVPVYWELIEPEEGRFDFSLVDGLIRAARDHDTKLVLLWFGSWKNSMSSYVPGWVKRDQARFPRAKDADGKSLEMLTAFHSNNRNADAQAFAALMQHLNALDRNRHTVLMVQVENEIGMIPSARDYSEPANTAFRAKVPDTLLSMLTTRPETLHPALLKTWKNAGGKTSGSWAGVFGDTPAGHEIFMAWTYAQYTDYVAAAGRAEHDIPLFVNAALIRPGAAPGDYPAAGPLPHLYDIWTLGAPTIDMLSPDIYFPNFVEWSKAYDVPGNPMFVPETGRQPEATPANALYVFAEHDSMGFSPFSIEDYGDDAALADAYARLEELAPLLLAHQGKGTMRGVRPPVGFDGAVDTKNQQVRFEPYTFDIRFRDPWTPEEAQTFAAHGGLILRLSEDEFLIAGKGITLTFAQDDGLAGIESIWEGRYEGGRWIPGRLLNGDQSHQGRHVRLPPDRFHIQRVRLYRYQ